MSKLTAVFLILVGLINFIPVLGIFSQQNIENAYSIKLASDDLIILMKHRALLFGVIGGFVLYSVFVPSYQTAAMVLVGISMIGFVFLVLQVGEYNQSIFKILIADLVGIVFLLLAVISRYINRTSLLPNG
ncbi:MAG: hypothetical protein ACPGJI_00750 [Kangiellaceae bacterium]